MFIHRKEIDNIQFNPIQLKYLGAGFPLYFSFLKYCIFMLCIMLISSASYNFISNGFISPDSRSCITVEQQEYQQQHCQEVNLCTINRVTRFSLADKRDSTDLNIIQNILNVICLVCIIILLIVLRIRQQKISEQCDDEVISPSDYTLWIRNVPSQYNNAKILQEKLQEVFKKDIGQNLVIKDISLVYNTADLEKKLQNQISEYENKLGQAKSEQQEQQNIKNIHQEYRQKIRNTVQQLKQIPILEPEKFVNQAFVSFEYQEVKDSIVDIENEKIIKKLYWPLENGQNKQEKLKISKSEVEPGDLIWQNLHLSSWTKSMRKYSGICLTILFLMMSFFLIFYITSIQREYQIDIDKQLKQSTVASHGDQGHSIDGIQLNSFISHQHLQENQNEQNQNDKEFNVFDLLMNNSNLCETNTNINKHNKLNLVEETSKESVVINDIIFKIKLLSYLLAGLIPILNVILSQVVTYCVLQEGNKTETGQQVRLATNLTFITFINTAIQTFVITTVFQWFFGGYESGKVSLYQNGGLIYNQQNIFFTTNIVMPLIMLIYSQFSIYNFGYMFKKLLECTKSSLGIKSDYSNLSQINFNKYQDPPEFILTYRYQYILSNMFMAAFYSPLLPIGLFYTAIGMYITYIIDKKTILQSRVCNTIRNKLSIEMIENLEHFLTIYCVSNMIFTYLLIEDHKDIHGFWNITWNIIVEGKFWQQVGLFLGIINSILPMQQLVSIYKRLGDFIGISQFLESEPDQVVQIQEESKKFRVQSWSESLGIYFNVTYNSLNPINKYELFEI